MKLLLIEDDPQISEILELVLEEQGYQVELKKRGDEGLKRGLEGNFELIVLDLGLPGLDGIEVCKSLRAANITTPILMLTAREEDTDRVKGLDSGADDYLTKPFSQPEFLARLRALSRRAISKPQELSQYKNLSLDLNHLTASYQGQTITLTRREFELLAYLINKQGAPSSREELAREVWEQADSEVKDLIKIYIARLRQKLGNAKLISSRRGVGYWINGD